MANVYTALVHHPVLDKLSEVITTSITNIDVHDLSRTSRTYGVKNFFIVTPIDAQRELVQKIFDHWKPGQGGAKRIPARSEALSRAMHQSSIEASIDFIQSVEKKKPLILTTSAQTQNCPIISYVQASELIQQESPPVLILFGSGYGLAPSVHEKTDYVLEPIQAQSDYNHLSVRAAFAITLDRLLGFYASSEKIE